MCKWFLIICVTELINVQNNASKLLLAIMESRHDSENADRILFNIQFKQLVCVFCANHLTIFDNYEKFD